MRVNVDSSVVTDPRMHLLARHLGVNVHEAIGRILRVWFVCYDRRSSVLQSIEIEIAADRDGFAEAMMASGLAENDEQGVYVRGVTERIEFLEKQSEKGKRSGEIRRNRTNLRTPAQQGFAFGSNQNGTSVEQRYKSGRTNPRTYSPDQDLDLAPDQAPDHVPRGTSYPQPSTGADLQNPQSLQNGAGQRDHQTGTDGGPSAENAARGKLEREVPDAAHTLAWLLLNAITRNHGTGRLAKSPERVKEHTARKWAETIDKMSRLDRLSWTEIEAMIHWSQRHSFWSGVILGADNLRDKWDKMAAQRNQKPGARTAQPSHFDVLEEHATELERRTKEQPTK